MFGINWVAVAPTEFATAFALSLLLMAVYRAAARVVRT